MTVLKRFRLSPRWVVLSVGLAALLVTTASLTPHNELSESDDASCLVCKAGQQPFQHLAPVLDPEPAIARSSAVPKEITTRAGVVFVSCSCPRAPPA